MELIHPLNYYEPSILKKEHKNIFSNRWIFACLLNEVSNEKDFFVLNVAETSIIVYNNGKEIKAFQNACPHRFNKIFTSEKGNDNLLCKYHSWGFTKDGQLIGKEQKKLLGVKANENVCLHQYSIEIVGNFVFINLNSNPESLERQLGNLKQDILLVSEILGEKIGEKNIKHNNNWKFIVENVIENEHCKALHQETLGKSGYCSNQPEIQCEENDNSYFIISPILNEARKKRDNLFEKFLPRKISTNKYKHILFFPNFTISIFEGLIITIGQVVPIDSESSSYRLQFFYSSLTKENHISGQILSEMKKETLDFSERVFQEDKEILEQLQKGVKQISHSGFIYESEKRLKWFIETYHKYMK